MRTDRHTDRHTHRRRQKQYLLTAWAQVISRVYLCLVSQQSYNYRCHFLTAFYIAVIFRFFVILRILLTFTDVLVALINEDEIIKGKGHTPDIAPLGQETSPQKCSGMAHVVEGFQSFTCTPRRLSTVGMNHTCLCPPSCSWFSF